MTDLAGVVTEPGMWDTGYRRSPADHRDYSYRERVLGIAPAGATKALPASFRLDKRTPLPVYNQGAVPSCMGWAVATAQTGQERYDKRRTVRHDGLEFYQRIALPGGGAYPRDAMALWSERGVQTEAGKLHKISAYAAVDPRDHDAVRHAIVTGRGVIVGFMVTRAWAQNGGREFSDTGGDELGGHAMYVPGYTSGGPEGLNTWGEGWARNGRAILPWAYWDRHVWECWTVTDLND